MKEALGAARTARPRAPSRLPAAAQHVCKLPLPAEASVGIVGGGLSGAVLAAALSARGVHSTVYDTGKHGLGGRLATRDTGLPSGLVFDHAAQYFTASDPRFEQLVQRWVASGAVRQWIGAVHSVSAGGSTLLAGKRWVAGRGFRHLVDFILENDAPLATVKRPCWVETMVPGERRAWQLLQNGRIVGEHDFVVVAHNGKCANKLMGGAGVPKLDAAMRAMKLNSIWATLVAFDASLGAQVEGAYVDGVPALSWAANNTAKLSRTGPECWTLLSTAAYGRLNKCPQENVPPATSARVAAEMMAALAAALRVELPPPLFVRTQLWGAALPTNSPRTPCLFDGAARAGMCGDWLLGSTVEAAALSGMAMAQRISEAVAAGGCDLSGLSCGLDAPLMPLGSHDIGTTDLPVRRAYTSRGQAQGRRAAPAGR